MVLSHTGLTVDCIEAGQQAVCSYGSVSHEALTQHVTFSNTTALQRSPRNRTKHAHKRDNHYGETITALTPSAILSSSQRADNPHWSFSKDTHLNTHNHTWTSTSWHPCYLRPRTCCGHFLKELAYQPSCLEAEEHTHLSRLFSPSLHSSQLDSKHLFITAQCHSFPKLDLY